jgi:hypothetical protein
MFTEPPISTAENERLKQSIKEHGGVLNAIVINRLGWPQPTQACKELAIPVKYNVMDFTGRS